MTIIGSLLFPLHKIGQDNEGLTGPSGSITQKLAVNEDSVDNMLKTVTNHTGSRHQRRLTAIKTGPGYNDYITREVVIAIVILILIDIMILCLAIHYIMECSKNRGWGTGMMILLIVLMLTPSIGPFVTFGIIAYGAFGGCKPKMSFHFY